MKSKPIVTSPKIWIMKEANVEAAEAERIRKDYRSVAIYTQGRIEPILVDDGEDAIVVLLSYRFPGTGGSQLYKGRPLTVINPRYSSSDTVFDELGHQLQNHICVPKLEVDLLNLTNLYMDTSNMLFWLRIHFGFASVRV